MQIEGVDFYDTFALVVRWSTIRIVISLATTNNWHIHQYDVKTAFLNGKISEDVYMHIPEGFRNPKNEGHVCKMQKALYGLRQAPRAWYTWIDSYLRSDLNLTRSCADSNMYFSVNNDKYVILLLYVDDLLLTGNDEESLTKIKTKLMQEYEMTYLGQARLYLGVELLYNSLGTWLHQKRYIESLLIRFGMEQCNTLSIPMTQSTHLKTDMESPPCDLQTYQALVGCLLFVTITRPDISFSVGCVSRYLLKPQQAHLTATKNILRYLKGTLNYGLCISNNVDCTLTSYTDADYARDVDTRRSTSGIIHKLGNSPVDWSSKRQSTVAMSTTEAEYRVLSEASKDIVHLRRLLTKLEVCDTNPTTLLSNNQSCIKLVANPILHARTKHIEIEHHFIREKAIAGDIAISYIRTAKQLADVLTKPLTTSRHAAILEQIGIRPLPY
jgi:hypothetical protein